MSKKLCTFSTTVDHKRINFFFNLIKKWKCCFLLFEIWDQRRYSRSSRWLNGLYVCVWCVWGHWFTHQTSQGLVNVNKLKTSSFIETRFKFCVSTLCHPRVSSSVFESTLQWLWEHWDCGRPIIQQTVRLGGDGSTRKPRIIATI